MHGTGDAQQLGRTLGFERVTNSSLVVPFGSLQVENGVNWAVHAAVRVLDGSETRLRVGAFRCGELLIDLPNYVKPLDGSPPDVLQIVISAKRQLFIRSPSFSLSMAAGIGVPDRRIRIVERGYTVTHRTSNSRGHGP
jgi:hypothetical protein